MTEQTAGAGHDVQDDPTGVGQHTPGTDAPFRDRQRLRTTRAAAAASTTAPVRDARPEPAHPLAQVPSQLRRRQPLWTNRIRTTWASLDLTDSCCRVQVVGRLDAAALQPYRAALDAALDEASGRECPYVVIDLSRTTTASPLAVSLLSAGRRYLRHRGMDTVLLDIPDALHRALRSAHVESLYDIRSSTQIGTAAPA